MRRIMSTAAALRRIQDLPGPRGWPLPGNTFQVTPERIHLDPAASPELMRFTVVAIAGLAFGKDINTLESGDDVIQRHLDKVLPAIFRRAHRRALLALVPHRLEQAWQLCGRAGMALARLLSYRKPLLGGRRALQASRRP